MCGRGTDIFTRCRVEPRTMHKRSAGFLELREWSLHYGDPAQFGPLDGWTLSETGEAQELADNGPLHARRAEINEIRSCIPVFADPPGKTGAGWILQELNVSAPEGSCSPRGLRDRMDLVHRAPDGS